MTDFDAAVKQAMAECQITPPEQIVFDDAMHRFSTNGKASDDSGYYRMTIDEGGKPFAFGFFGCWRSGIQENWHSKGDSDIDPERIKKAVSSVQRKRAAETRKLNAEAAEKAAERWSKATTIQTSEYLANKQIDPSSLSPTLAKQSGELLVIALRNAKGEVKNLQYIWPDGTKRFIKGSSTKGLYAAIGGKPKPKSRIWVAEGVATAHSVNQMTGQTTIIAFSADKLYEVGAIIGEKYPDCTICMAGDSGVVGENKASAAALAFNSIVSCPPAELQYGDWNDAVVDMGIDRARELFESRMGANTLVKKEPEALTASPPGEEEPGPVDDTTTENPKAMTGDWIDGLIMTLPTKGREPQPLSNKHNYRLYLEHHTEFAGMFAYCDFRYAEVLLKYPSWWVGPTDVPCPRHLKQGDYELITMRLMQHSMTAAKTGDVMPVVRLVADRRHIHPLRDLLNSLKWDGKPRIDNWLTTVMGVVDNDYSRMVGRKFLIQAANRILNPGCKADHSLVIEGVQGLGKSRLVRELSMGFSTDAHIDFKNRYGPMYMFGHWFVELSELTSLKRSDSDSTKAFLSRQEDQYQPPYQEPMTKGRQQVFVGTTNESEYLVDSTGNRRFWPVHAVHIDIDLLIEEREQMWAEAVQAARSGEAYWLDSKEIERIAVETGERVQADAWQMEIEDYINSSGFEAVTLGEIVKEVIFKDIPPDRLGQFDTKRIGAILRNIGFTERRHLPAIRVPWAGTRYGNRPYLWTRKGEPLRNVFDAKRLKMSSYYNKRSKSAEEF